MTKGSYKYIDTKLQLIDKQRLLSITLLNPRLSMQTTLKQPPLSPPPLIA
jgi:hypothetical protein